MSYLYKTAKGSFKIGQLYRRCLKTLKDHAPDRELLCFEARRISKKK
jgi:hypothetical protein